MKSSQWMWFPKDLIPFTNLLARSTARFLSFWTMTRTVWVWTAWFNAVCNPCAESWRNQSKQNPIKDHISKKPKMRFRFLGRVPHSHWSCCTCEIPRGEASSLHQNCSEQMFGPAGPEKKMGGIGLPIHAPGQTMNWGNELRRGVNQDRFQVTDIYGVEALLNMDLNKDPGRWWS